nr:Coenzyme F420 hydrogenase/dehydrogenase, beta subunit C-terminal domain [Nocardioides terrae]
MALTTSEDPARTFAAICPGRSVRSPHPRGVQRDPLLGSYLGVWAAYAADPAVRHAGSSGGVLTALAGWLVENGEIVQFVGAGPSLDARRTVPVSIGTKEEALAAAGSRYAPVSNAARATFAASDGLIGKPCEASAVRALAERVGSAPLVLSFFCAGTPNQFATDDLVELLGLPDAGITSLRYRGHGWPGAFVASDGNTVRSMSYDESWGKHLGPTMQWRCKLCADGVGESADIVAGDFWDIDERGYPLFTEGDGRSAVTARTERGADVVRRAIAAGVLIADEVGADEVAAVQPSQRKRRTSLAGRLAGCLSAGRRVPRYHGFGLLALAARDVRENLRAARGGRRRIVASRRSPVPDDTDRRDRASTGSLGG